jgi:hypothetical protein
MQCPQRGQDLLLHLVDEVALNRSVEDTETFLLARLTLLYYESYFVSIPTSTGSELALDRKLTCGIIEEKRT